MITVTGSVIKGSKDGRKLGFPTANIALTQIPEIDYGVYASIIRIEDREFNSVTHYGPRLIFDEVKPQFEVHIFNFNAEIYNQLVEVDLIKFLRSTIKFDSLELMVEQIHNDIENAKIALGLTD